MNHCLRIFLLLVVAFAMAHASHAQNIPGRWHKVALPQPSRIGIDNTADFSFIDSLHGICLSDNGLISSTTNGGRLWSLDTDLKNSYTYKNNLNSLECTAPHHGFLHGQEATLSITPGGTSLFGFPENGEVNSGAYFTLAEKMYDTAYGFRIVELISTRDPNEFDDSVIILVTHDGWHSSTEYGPAYILSPDPATVKTSSMPMFIGYIVDSNDVWTASGSIDYPYNKIIHTSNGGASWETFEVFGNLVSQTQVKDLFVNPKTRDVFYLCNLGDSQNSYSSRDVDYAHSSDYGATWQLDSTFGVHLWRMANPAPGILWAMIGQSGPGWTGADVEIIPHEDVHAAPDDYCRKIGYSSDNGATWLIDSTTFINDSLEEMHFTDVRHGWVASWSHDSLFMWYYNADTSGTRDTVMTVTPLSWNFGSIGKGHTGTATFTISNSSSPGVAISGSVESPTDANLVIQSGAGPFTLSEGGTKTVTVLYTSQDGKDRSATMTITGPRAPDKVIVNLLAASSGVASDPGGATAFVVFPNPVLSTITVAGMKPVVTIYDALGRTRDCPLQGNTFDISRLPAGVYYVSDGTRRARFVKE